MSAKAIADALIESQALNADTGRQALFSDDKLIATWVASESVDANLSHVQLADGSPIRGVRKYRHVTGLSFGVQVVIEGIGPNKNATIVGILEGDITLYEAED